MLISLTENCLSISVQTFCYICLGNIKQKRTWPVFSHHSQKHPLSFSLRLGKFECNTEPPGWGSAC